MYTTTLLMAIALPCHTLPISASPVDLFQTRKLEEENTPSLPPSKSSDPAFVIMTVFAVVAITIFTLCAVWTIFICLKSNKRSLKKEENVGEAIVVPVVMVVSPSETENAKNDSGMMDAELGEKRDEETEPMTSS